MRPEKRPENEVWIYYRGQRFKLKPGRQVTLNGLMTRNLNRDRSQVRLS